MAKHSIFGEATPYVIAFLVAIHVMVLCGAVLSTNPEGIFYILWLTLEIISGIFFIGSIIIGFQKIPSEPEII